MSDVSRIFVVEGEERLNRNLVNALRKDGYAVQSAINGTDAVRALWAAEYDIVICDLRTQGIDGLELLQWLRMHRPSTRAIMLGNAGTIDQVQVLESGAASFIEKPVDLRALKEEIRRMTQQTGFTASLDSFDLLDVIQVINMSRNNIALLINTGLEEHGVLRFQLGELVWAEYGVLRGEEAFFALAAHKNGTVTQQPWNGRITSNVTQPLSRLIFQALQYRAKYSQTPPSEDQNALPPFLQGTSNDEIDDTPFGFVAPLDEPLQSASSALPLSSTGNSQEILPPAASAAPREEGGSEWWERTGGIPKLSGISSLPQQSAQPKDPSGDIARALHIDKQLSMDGLEAFGTASIYKNPPAPQTPELPEWLTDQPTSSSIPVVRSGSTPTSSSSMPRIPITPLPSNSTDDWKTSLSSGVTEDLENDQPTMARKAVKAMPPAMSSMSGVSGTMPPLRQPFDSPDALNTPSHLHSLSSLNTIDYERAENAVMSRVKPRVNGNKSYNYGTLVSALQTLSYNVIGFIAAAVVSIDGRPLAEVTMSELDIAPLCKHYATALNAITFASDQYQWGEQEETIITHAQYYVLLRMVGKQKKMFSLLVTRRDADLQKNLDAVHSIEDAITGALEGM